VEESNWRGADPSGRVKSQKKKKKKKKKKKTKK
jgi:hypothetical protein